MQPEQKYITNTFLLVNLTVIIYSRKARTYRFSGYEKDQESQLNYAHNRYYWSDGSIFTSTEPMWWKFPWITPYAYSLNNPISYNDPDGRQPRAKVLPPLFGTMVAMHTVADMGVRTLNYTDFQDLFTLGSAIVSVFTGSEPKKFHVSLVDGKIQFKTIPASGEDVDAAKMGLLIPVASGSSVRKVDNVFDAMKARRVVSGSEAAKLAKNTDRMLDKDLNKILGEGWHSKGSTAKKNYVKTYEKELRGNTNPDFYIDKNNGDIFLKSTQSGNPVWVKTKNNIKDFE